MSGLIIGTRGSRLALAQARAVASSLGGEAAGIELKIIQTRGDLLREMRFSEQLDKGFFTTELERALSAGEVDLVVHSLKDLPTESPPGLMIGATPQRAPTGDVLLVRPDALVDGEPDGPLPLADGARVGTSAARRRALLAHLSPQVEGVDFRGNVPTRVEKCLRGEVDAIILARAGLSRLGLDISPLLAFDLDTRVWIPAPGQGALAIQCRDSDPQIRSHLAALDHAPSSRAVSLERTVLATLEGGCHAACGAVLLPLGEGLGLYMGMVLDVARGWQTGLLPLPLDGGPREAELAQVVAEVDALQKGASRAGGTGTWWSPAHPWELQ
jgi:hydroxymethylbilane synthase